MRRWPTRSARAGAAVVLGEAPAGAKTLATVHSAPISRLVEQALSMSDNMLAEALARQVAIARKLPASFEGSAQAVIGALADAKIDVTGVTLNDGSGLSRDDRVPASVLTAVVSGAADDSLKGTSAILSGLPVAGYDGTLFDRGDAEDGARHGPRQDRDPARRARARRHGGDRRRAAARLLRGRRRLGQRRRGRGARSTTSRRRWRPAAAA